LVVPWWPVPKASAGLDLDRHIVDAPPLAVVRAVHQDAPGAHGVQPFQRRLHPILLFQRHEHRFVRLVAHEGTDEFADRVLVGLGGEIGLQQPGSAILGLEGGHRGFGGVEDLADDVRHGPGRPLVGGEAHHMGGAVGVQAFEHGRRLAPLGRVVTRPVQFQRVVT
jgi:hypothetical protein